MILEKKVYKDIEIDFLTFVSLLQIMTRKPIKELERLKNLDSLYVWTKYIDLMKPRLDKLLMNGNILNKHIIKI